MTCLRECAGRSPETGPVLAARQVVAGDVGRQLVGYWFPDQLGDVEDEIGLWLVRICLRAHLADTDADGVVQSPVLLGVAEMEDRTPDLPPFRRVRAPVSVPLEPNRRSIVGLDHRTEVRPKRTRRGAPTREVRTSEAPGDRALAPAFGDKQVLFPTALETDHPALGIRET